MGFRFLFVGFNNLVHFNFEFYTVKRRLKQFQARGNMACYEEFDEWDSSFKQWPSELCCNSAKALLCFNGGDMGW